MPRWTSAMNESLEQIVAPENDPAEWIERRLFGAALPDVIATLQSMRPATNDDLTLADVLGEHASAVAEKGLATLPADRLQQLMNHPELLYELRDWTLIEGGDHWTRVAAETPEV